MGLTNLSVHNSTSEPYSYVKAGTFGAAAPAKHKGFAITTGFTSSATNTNFSFDVLFRDSSGATFYNRIAVPSYSTAYFPIQIAGVSGSATNTRDEYNTLMYYY